MFYFSKANKLSDVGAQQIHANANRTALPERAVPGGLEPTGLQRLQPRPELFPRALLSGAELAATRKGFSQVVSHTSGGEERGQDGKGRSRWELGNWAEDFWGNNGNEVERVKWHRCPRQGGRYQSGALEEKLSRGLFQRKPVRNGLIEKNL